MGKIIYVTGGARSGKSSYAEELIFESKKERIYIATSIAFDGEMKERVRLHKLQRGEEWITIEAYKGIPKYLETYKNEEMIILLDCLTNFVSNNMILETERDWDNISQEELSKIEKEIEVQVIEILEFVKESKLDMVVVSNEIGMGVVPPYALGRYFRDICGRMNQLVGKKADEAHLVVSGLKIKLK